MSTDQQHTRPFPLPRGVIDAEANNALKVNDPCNPALSEYHQQRIAALEFQLRRGVTSRDKMIVRLVNALATYSKEHDADSAGGDAFCHCEMCVEATAAANEAVKV